MNDLDVFTNIRVRDSDKYFMSYVKANTECDIIINFKSLKITSEGANSYNSNHNISFKGVIVSALYNGDQLTNEAARIIFPTKSFKKGMNLYGCTYRDYQLFETIQLKFKRISKRRYDILEIKRLDGE